MGDLSRSWKGWGSEGESLLSLFQLLVVTGVPWLVDGFLLPESSHCLPFKSVSLSKFALFRKEDTRQVGLPHLNMILCKDPISNKVTFIGTEDQDFCVFLGRYIQYIALTLKKKSVRKNICKPKSKLKYLPREVGMNDGVSLHCCPPSLIFA